jgi:hypothetical protein
MPFIGAINSPSPSPQIQSCIVFNKNVTFITERCTIHYSGSSPETINTRAVIDVTNKLNSISHHKPIMSWLPTEIQIHFTAGLFLVCSSTQKEQFQTNVCSCKRKFVQSQKNKCIIKILHIFRFLTKWTWRNLIAKRCNVIVVLSTCRHTFPVGHSCIWMLSVSTVGY